MEKRNYLVFSAYPLSFLLLWWARNYPQQLEYLYGRRLYPFLKEIRLGIFDFLPFSFGDFFYTVLSVYAIGLIRTGIRDWRKGCFQLFAALGVLLLWFQLSWGLHYYRPMASNNKAVRYTEDELLKTAEQLAQEANTLHTLLVKDHTKAVKMTNTSKELIERVGQRNAAAVKVSTYSSILSYMGFSGYLNPFTLEAHINGDMPQMSMPITIAHEMAHQEGIAAENDANFKGFLDCYTHPDLDIRYAAVLFAYQKCIGSLASVRPEVARELNCLLHPGILANYSEIFSYWRQHQNPIEPYIKSSYDRYLKANNQAAGILSYNAVVGQIVSYFKQNSKQ